MTKKEKEKEKESHHKQAAVDKKAANKLTQASLSTEEIIEKKQKDYDALWDKYLRLQAEFDNYKKRTLREKSEFIKFANEGLIVELLSILDNFERGVKAADLNKDFELLHQGVDMISKQLHALLETKGLRRIKSLGEKFNPHQHDAMEVVEEEGVEDEIVVEELQPGYALNDRIIRPAKVKVVKKKTIEDRVENKEEGGEPTEEVESQEEKESQKKEENNSGREE